MPCAPLSHRSAFSGGLTLQHSGAGGAKWLYLWGRLGISLEAVAAGTPSNAMSPQAARSFRLLWWIALGPIVGFMLGSLFLSDSWPLWQVVPLALLLAAPFAVGALYGFAAIRRHDRAGWFGFVIHLMLMTMAIVMPISESLSH